MSKNITISFSNHLAILYQHLKQALFGSSATPFKRRLVIVYGPAMKAWLMLKMAQDPDLGIAAGVEFIYFNQAFDYFLKLYQTSTCHIPSQLELTLAIEKEILFVLQTFPSLREEQQEWRSLLHYLKLDPHHVGPSLKLSRKMEKRLISLSQHVAHLFQEYGRYAGPLISKWETCPQVHWQARLWTLLFNEKMGWTYPIRAFQLPLQAIPNCEIHFFSISFISSAEFNFLHRLADFSPIHYYLLSPCAVFWSDIRSDKENAYLQAYWQQRLGSSSPQVLKLEELLRDRNPLLANFGRLGREMACQIEESLAQTYAQYLLPSHVRTLDEELFIQDDLYFIETAQPLTLLHAIQADMLLMRNPQEKGVTAFKSEDFSIQLHSAPTKRREVEILYHNLLAIIEKQPTISPSDIIIMAPQIVDYVPYIHSIFGASDSQIDFQILDLGMQTQNEIVQGFLQLLALCESRWDARHLLQLFEHRSFQRRHQLTVGDYYIIQEWVEKAGIRWGDDWLHRNELLQRRHCQQGMVEETAIGTWDFGLSRLLYGLTTVLKSGKSDVVDTIPCEAIDFSQTELMGRWIRLLHSLRDDLSPLQDRTQMTMEDWTHYLLCLIENYFQPDFDDSQSVEDYEELKSQFEILKASSRTFKNARFSFQSVKTHLNTLLQHRGITYRENQLQAVRFCSLMPLRSIPAKVIALLGMQEGSFPRTLHQSSLNLMMGQENIDYSPSSTDYDRYLFLEALHSAQDYVVISYQGYSQQDNKELQPSLVVEELLSYLDKYYSLQGKKVSDVCSFKHPFDSFDARYFQSQTPLSNFSIHHFRAAQAYYKGHKGPPHRFLNDFVRIEHPQSDLIPNDSVLDLKYLNAAARNPIKFYLNRALDIYLQSEEDRTLKNEEDLSLSALDKYQLKQVALKEPLEAVLNRAEKEGKMPFGLFKTVATRRLKEEVSELQERLQKFGIHPKEIFQIEFCTSCLEPTQLEEDRWLFPAISLTYSDGYKLSIIGKLSHVTPKGLLVVSKGTLSDTWRAWPQFLLYDYATKLYPGELARQLVLAYAAQPKKAFFDDAEPYLKQFIHYYALCLKNFSPLLPDWIPLILEKDIKGLQDKMRQLFSDSFASYQSHDLRWILNKECLPNAETMLHYWKEQTELLVGDLVRFWYPPKQVGISEEI